MPVDLRTSRSLFDSLAKTANLFLTISIEDWTSTGNDAANGSPPIFRPIFGGPGATHFGPQAIHGAVRNLSVDQSKKIEKSLPVFDSTCRNASAAPVRLIEASSPSERVELLGEICE